ncbi:hypothetical protein [Terrarubrum flagellatum]|uniref:hypothetical protein n=1 Tax=Terrirubrum flagellatum TaxID=2895980 RepID=UPI003144E509
MIRQLDECEAKEPDEPKPPRAVRCVAELELLELELPQLEPELLELHQDRPEDPPWELDEDELLEAQLLRYGSMIEPAALRHLGSPGARVTCSAVGRPLGLIRRKAARSTTSNRSCAGATVKAASQMRAPSMPASALHCATDSTTRPSAQVVREPMNPALPSVAAPMPRPTTGAISERFIAATQ